MAEPTIRPQCTGCGELLNITRTGNIIHFTHNPASPTGHTCPQKEN